MKKKRTHSFFVSLLMAFGLGGAGQASLLSLEGLYSTGVDGAGVPLAAGVADSHYTLITQPAADPSAGAVAINTAAFPISPNGPWLAANGTSGWIGGASNARAYGGPYVFRTGFTVPAGVDPGKIRISGVWTADDPGTASVSLNGALTGIAAPAGFAAFSPAWTLSSGFVSGQNNLDFAVPDTAAATGGCCMGLRVEIQEFSYDIGLYNTGVDGSRVSLADDAADAHWSITSGPTVSGPLAATSAGGFPIGPWLGDSATSAWISPTANTSADGGQYTYQTTFDLTGIEPSTFNLSGRMSADNSVVDILLNGVSTGSSFTGFNAWGPFSLDNGSGNGFSANVNTLEFLVDNAASGPAGLRVEFTDVTGSFVPEPSSVILLLFGAALLCCRRRVARVIG